MTLRLPISISEKNIFYILRFCSIGRLCNVPNDIAACAKCCRVAASNQLGTKMQSTAHLDWALPTKSHSDWWPTRLLCANRRYAQRLAHNRRAVGKFAVARNLGAWQGRPADGSAQWPQSGVPAIFHRSIQCEQSHTNGGLPEIATAMDGQSGFDVECTASECFHSRYSLFGLLPKQVQWTYDAAAEIRLFARLWRLDAAADGRSSFGLEDRVK